MKSHISRKKLTHKDSGKYCSTVMCCSWSLIGMWVLFLLYCWQSGFLVVDKKKFDALVDNVDKVVIETENTLLDRLHTLNHLQIQHGMDSQEQHTGPSDEVHIVFSTDCRPYQDWQTLVLFHSAKVVGQKGRITRIASGCDDAKKAYLDDLYQKLYNGVYGAHYTPDFKKDAKTKKSYDFYNKPWGMKHFLEHSHPPVKDDVYIALLDPDQILLRPITVNIRSMPDKIFDRRLPESEIIDNISIGHPVAQTYGLGAPWTNDNHKKFNRGKICGEGSPCLKPQREFGELHYSVGPPYIAHRVDMLRIVSSWTTFVPRVYEGYPYLLAEMYAYSMAAAHEELPHLQLENYMVSNVDAGGEGWPHVDRLKQVCIPPTGGIYYPNDLLPTVLHFCQTYRAGEIGFMKRRVPHDIFTCESPMLVDPPANLAAEKYIVKEGKKEAVKNARKMKRNAFMVCILHDAINSALIDFKQRMCNQGNVTNYDKKLNIARL